MKCCVLGTGTWGTALAQLLVDNGNDVIQYGIDLTEINDINTNHKNSKYFGDKVILPVKLKATSDLSLALEGSEVIIVAVPTIAVRGVLKEVKTIIKKNHTLLVLQKDLIQQQAKE